MFQLNIKPGSDHIIYTDKNKFQRIINNLLGNAVKYTRNGFLKITAQIKCLQFENSMDIGSGQVTPFLDSPRHKQEDFYFSKLFEQNELTPVSKNKRYGKESAHKYAPTMPLF